MEAHDAFDYADLTSRIGQRGPLHSLHPPLRRRLPFPICPGRARLKKDAAAYEDQVKGPVVDHAAARMHPSCRAIVETLLRPPC